jgi:hypothetical protein
VRERVHFHGSIPTFTAKSSGEPDQRAPEALLGALPGKTIDPVRKLHQTASHELQQSQGKFRTQLHGFLDFFMGPTHESGWPNRYSLFHSVRLPCENRFSEELIRLIDVQHHGTARTARPVPFLGEVSPTLTDAVTVWLTARPACSSKRRA